MIKLEKKKSCIIWILMTVICTFFVCMIGSVSIEAKTVTKDITIGKGKTYAIEQTFSGKATFKTSLYTPHMLSILNNYFHLYYVLDLEK
jgi:hypothetical protein